MIAKRQETTELAAPSLAVPQAGIRTFSVFTDLPRLVEFRMGDMPVLSPGTVVEFNVRIRSPRDPTRVRLLDGPYVLTKRLLKYTTLRSGRQGLTQYLEWSPDEAHAPGNGH